MTYYKDADEAVNDTLSDWRQPADKCFCCKGGLVGDMVTYDGFEEDGRNNTLWMHKKCAFEMAQRIICDAWPNRLREVSIYDKKLPGF